VCASSLALDNLTPNVYGRFSLIGCADVAGFTRERSQVRNPPRPLSVPRLNDPQTLYRHWEQEQWNPWDIDLAPDREQWAGMEDRSLIEFVLGSLMVAEERITTKFSGLVGAHDTEEEATFLATQQVDEARHMQFYARFQDEVVAAPAQIGAHVSQARAQVSAAFRTIFDEKLVAADERLRINPRDRAAKVAFVTIYHLILEATLGLTTFEFTTSFLQRDGLLPGFVSGYTKIHHDEQRHIAYGVWFLREAVSGDREMGDVVRSTLRELLPAVAESLTLPAGADQSLLGASQEELRSFALDGLRRRMNIIGVPLETL
jgi:ribonucleoside-diphosphate reductase beta chain